jgi:hypothetical protein
MLKRRRRNKRAVPVDAGLARLSVADLRRSRRADRNRPGPRRHEQRQVGALDPSGFRTVQHRTRDRSGSFAELQERGFIDCMAKGAFSRKALHATEWRLTWWTCDVTGELPSKKFMSWGREKQNTVSKYPVAVSNQSQRAA